MDMSLWRQKFIRGNKAEVEFSRSTLRKIDKVSNIAQQLKDLQKQEKKAVSALFKALIEEYSLDGYVVVKDTGQVGRLEVGKKPDDTRWYITFIEGNSRPRWWTFDTIKDLRSACRKIVEEVEPVEGSDEETIKANIKKILKERTKRGEETLKLFLQEHNLAGDVVIKKRGTRGRLLLERGERLKHRWLFFHEYTEDGTLSKTPSFKVGPTDEERILGIYIEHTLEEVEACFEPAV